MLEIRLLTTPEVLLNGEKIKFPFKKAEALFFVLVYHQRMTREQLINMFWSDLAEDVAKKNLRNALYLLKQCLPNTLFVRYTRQELGIECSQLTYVDINLFFEGDLRVYQEGFLHDFYVKEAYGFENWLHVEREKIKERYISMAYQRLTNETQAEAIIEWSKRIIKQDPYDEVCYRRMMLALMTLGHYNKAVDAYKQLEDTLSEDLGIGPDAATIETFKRVLEAKQHLDKDKQMDKFFFGRKDPLKTLAEVWQDVMDAYYTKCVVLTGEAGVGKSEIVAHFTHQIKGPVLKHIGVQEEQAFAFKSVERLLSDLSHLLQHPIEPIQEKYIKWLEREDHALLKTYQFVLEDLVSLINHPMVIWLDKWHWADRQSKQLIEGVIHSKRHVPILWLLTSRSLELTSLQKHHLSRHILVKPFSKSESLALVKSFCDFHDLQIQTPEVLVKEAEGNTLFLLESLERFLRGGHENSLGDEGIRRRLAELTPSARRVITVAACTIDRILLDDLVQISGQNEWDLTESLQELVAQRFLEEFEEGLEIYYRFSHQRIKHFINQHMLKAKKRIINKRLAEICQHKLSVTKDIMTYGQLIHHYHLAGDRFGELSSRIDYLSHMLQINHETFPVINYQPSVRPSDIYLSDTAVNEALERIDTLFDDLIVPESLKRKVMILRINEAHIKGRYGIKQGRYKEGLDWIDKMLELAMAIGDHEAHMKGLLQRINYHINRHDLPGLEAAVDQALAFVDLEDKSDGDAVLLRLDGLRYLLKGDFDLAEERLSRSLKLLLDHPGASQHVMGIMACYYYQSESKRLQGTYDQALQAIQEAIGLCKSHELFGRLTIFFNQAGLIAYDAKRFEQAHSYFKKANNLYEKYDYRWGRSVSMAFWTLCDLRLNGVQANHLLLLKEASRVADIMNNPYESGMINRARLEYHVIAGDQSAWQLDQHVLEDLMKTIKTLSAQTFGFMHDVVGPTQKMTQEKR